MSYSNYNTLVEVLENNPEERGITFIEGSEIEFFLGFQDLYTRALKVLFLLQEKGIKRKDELVIQVTNNNDFLIIFWACLLGGIIPIPLSLSRNDEHRLKVLNIFKILQNPYLVISPQDLQKYIDFSDAHEFSRYLDENSKVLTQEYIINNRNTQFGKVYYPKEDDIAYVQFSSGSTGNPKGVKLTHKNLLTNSNAILKGINSPENGDLFFSWMPLSHDMGLIGYHITPLVAGWNHYIMPTEIFIRKPSLWLQKIKEHKITFTASPNFGYRYLLNRIDNKVLENTDLSSLRIITNGAEPISADLCYEFLDRLGSYGLKRNVIFPVYGLAEASLAVTFSEPENEIKTLKLDRNFLKVGNKIRKVNPGDEGITLVNVGKAINHCNVRIALNGNIKAKEGIIGNIQIKGDNVTDGYYNNEVATRELISEDGWLNTGDLGFICEHCLYITGRLKDILFINGQNIYPHDVEKSLEKELGIELGKVAVGGYFNDNTKKEDVIAFVLYKSKIESFLDLYLSIKSKVNQVFGFELDKVLPTRDIPKTTSGKLQRYKLIEQYREGRFKDIEENLNAIIKNHEFKKTIQLPQNITQNKLYQIWKLALGDIHFGINDKFFEIGGNSLKGAQVLSKINEELNVELSFDTLFEKSTIRELALEIDSSAKVIYVPIGSVENVNPYPLSPSQRRIYYWWEVQKDSTAYNLPLAFKIDGELDINLLEICLIKIIDRHEVFKTYFFTDGSEPKQSIQQHLSFKLKTSQIDETNLNEELSKRVIAFNLAEAPLFRIELLKLTNSKYFLFLDFHHIIFDGFSINNFLNELLNLYFGKVLPPVDLQYRDIINWIKEQSSSERHKAQEKFWLNQFKDEVPILGMQTDYPRPTIRNYKGEKIEFELDSKLTSRLKQLCKDKQVSLFMLLLASYKVLLSKHTGQDDIIVGTPSAGRMHPQLHTSMGMFVNNLALRSYPCGEKTFENFLYEIKQLSIKAYDNQDYPFDDLAEKIELQRDLSRNLLFDTMFIFQNFELPENSNSKISVERYFFNPGFSKYDISLEMFDEGEIIKYYFEYSTELFRKERIVNISKHFKILLEQIVGTDLKLSDISILDHMDEKKMVIEFNETNKDYPKIPIIKQIEIQALKTPESIAVKDGDYKLTYKELEEKANNLAIYLNSNGASRNVGVGIYLERSTELVIGILSILKSGCYYVPIDIDLPDERIKYILSDSGSKFILTERKLFEKKNTLFSQINNLTVLFVDGEEENKEAPFQNEIKLTDLAYIIYTSGTTGNPKGVMIEHCSLANYINWAVSTYVKEEKLNFPLHTSVSFDLTVTSIFLPLLSGGSIDIYRDDEHLSIEKIIQSNKAEIIKLTPSHLNLINSSESLKLKLKESKLKKIIVGGEDLPRQLAEKIDELFNGNIEIYNEYGPTEATVGCMIYKYDRIADTQSSVPIGVPIANTQIYLLDKFKKPVPEGVVGEIYISGAGLSRGYKSNEEMTRSRFIDHPFIKNARIYKTGDLGIRISNGNIQFLGRSDHQIKLRGFRIELEEIENQITSLNFVEQAVVIGKKDNNNTNRLIAYYKSKGNQVIKDSTIKNQIAERLPHYMVPSNFIQVKEFVLTKNGKINLNELPVPDKVFQYEKIIKPDSILGTEISQVWQDVFSCSDIGMNSNFFEVGGDSIKAVQISSKLLNKNISLSPRDILTFQTIEKLVAQAKYLNESEKYSQNLIEGSRGLNPIESWFFSKNFVNLNYYVQSVLLKFDKAINSSILKNAFTVLIKHHDSLRLNYNPKEGTVYYNNNLIEQEFITEEYEIKNIQNEFENICIKVKRNVNILGGWPLKVAVIKNNDTHLVFITAHHLVIDGISWRILLEDLHLVYKALEERKGYNLSTKTASTIDWHNSLINYSKLIEKEKGYWQELNKGDKGLIRNKENKSKLIYNGITETRLEKSYSELLLKEFRTNNSDVLSILLLSLSLTLKKQFNKLKDIIIELENHGRHLDDINITRTIGWFTALFPFKLNLSDEDIIIQLNKISSQLHSVPNKGIGYGILKYYNKSFSEEDSSLIRFNYLGQFDKEIKNDLFQYEDRFTGLDSDIRNTLTTHLDMNCMFIKDELYVRILFSKLFDEDQIMLFKQDFLQNIRNVIVHIKKSLGNSTENIDFSTTELDDEDLLQLIKNN